MRLVVGLASVALALLGCSSGGGSSSSSDAGGALGAPCSGFADCRAPFLCSFPVDGGCSAHGTCTQENLSTSCQNGPTVCSCDGVTPVSLDCIYGAGRVKEPVASLTPGCTIDAGPPGDGGASPDGAVDAATGDAAADGAPDAGPG